MSGKIFLGLRQIVMVLLLFAALSGGPSQPVMAEPYAPQGSIAYVFRANDVDAAAFKALVDDPGKGNIVDLIPLGSVLSTTFTNYTLVIIADDTGSLNDWGTPADWASQVVRIKAPNVPILGIGEGGYAFFGKLGLFVGWPMGWHGPLDRVARASAVWDGSIFLGLSSNPVIHYGQNVNSVGIYVKNAPGDVNIVGNEVPPDDHANLIFQGCRFLWGSGGGAGLMTKEGQTLFVNYANYAKGYQCPPEQPPSPNCISLKKSALTEFSLATVLPNEVIAYTLEYTLLNSGGCSGYASGKLIDSIPPDTTFVAGSASDGVIPNAAGQLVWTVTAPASGAKKYFKVQVSPNQCNDQKKVINQASLEVLGFAPILSNVVTHEVVCQGQGITLPNHGPFYAEDEIEVHPYPLATGVPTLITARLVNPSAVAQPVTVQFQVAPVLGIGLTYATVATRTAVLPAGGTALISATFNPSFSGQTSFQVVVNGPGLNAPLITQSNLDMSEDFVAGTPDSLVFPVRNNTGATTNILLVVNNTCPGWTAVISAPAIGSFLGVLPGEIKSATLTVTPPASTILGSGCSIDVEAWDATTSRLISGIRKLDIPPVHLPPRVTPAWEEPEIVLVPDPPVVGASGQICVELTNPTANIKQVKIQYSVADFGAGIGFAPLALETFNLPPHSFGRYCTNWTPAPGGTLHKCILVTLQQNGFHDMTSQRNVDITRQTVTSLANFSMPFNVGSPDGLPHKLTFEITPVGIDPYWEAHILPLPTLVSPGTELPFTLTFTPALGIGSVGSTPPPTFQYGSISQVEVTILLDGVAAGGFTVQIDTPHLYMPLISR